MIKNFILILFFFMFVGTGIALSEVEEYELKAVYLERITRFVEWPEEGLSYESDDPFVIGILGENPFGTKLENLYADRRIKDKRIEIRYFSQLEQFEDCHLLFISQSVSEQLSQVLEVTHNKPVLTVGDTEGFAEMGVLVNFFIDEGKLRFEINEQGFHEADLLIDSLILKVAEIVNPMGGDR